MQRVKLLTELKKILGFRPYILRLPVFVEPDGDAFFAWVPGWDDVYAPGDTEEDALNNLAITAIAVYVSYRRRGMTIPYPYGFKKEDAKKSISFREVNVPIFA